MRHQELAFDVDGQENNHIHKFGHLYSKTFRPSLPGLPQGAGSRSSIMDSTTIGAGDDEEDEIQRKRKDEMDEELLKHRYGGTGSRSIHGVMNRLKVPSMEHSDSINDHDRDDSDNTSTQSTDTQSTRSKSHHDIRVFGRSNTLSDDREFIDPAYDEVDDHHSSRSKRRAFQEKLSKDITLHLGVAVREGKRNRE